MPLRSPSVANTKFCNIGVWELLQTPTPAPRDLLVRVKAISVNPVDYKVRASSKLQHPPKILGWDAAGIVEFVGKAVTGMA
ncbi:MAG: alcohol dehydrogenase catalytic domain-containing protein [Kovacikia sp.]